MAFNPFIGWSQAELEEALEAAQEDYSRGKTLSSIGSGDANSSKTIQMDALQRIKAILKALNVIDPTTYPSDSIHEVRRTQVLFTGYAPGTYGP